MPRPTVILLVGLLVSVSAGLCAGAGASEPAGGRPACTGDCHPPCAPRCKATWDEKKTKQTTYSIGCEYACTRGFDPWHAPAPECRCRPPCGDVVVKKRLYKTAGEERAERVPKYEVQMVPAEPCGCRSCRGHDHAGWWHPLAALASWLPW